MRHVRDGKRTDTAQKSISSPRQKEEECWFIIRLKIFHFCTFNCTLQRLSYSVYFQFTLLTDAFDHPVLKGPFFDLKDFIQLCFLFMNLNQTSLFFPFLVYFTNNSRGNVAVEGKMNVSQKVCELARSQSRLKWWNSKIKNPSVWVWQEGGKWWFILAATRSPHPATIFRLLFADSNLLFLRQTTFYPNNERNHIYGGGGDIFWNYLVKRIRLGKDL